MEHVQVTCPQRNTTLAVRRFRKPITVANSQRGSYSSLSWEERAGSSLLEKRGLMDYFQGAGSRYGDNVISRYENVVGYVLGLISAEGHRLDCNDFWKAEKGWSNLNPLKDFLQWFWNETVLDLGDGDVFEEAEPPKVWFS
jgi:hypothetical protein